MTPEWAATWPSASRRALAQSRWAATVRSTTSRRSPQIDPQPREAARPHLLGPAHRAKVTPSRRAVTTSPSSGGGPRDRERSRGTPTGRRGRAARRRARRPDGWPARFRQPSPARLARGQAGLAPSRPAASSTATSTAGVTSGPGVDALPSRSSRPRSSPEDPSGPAVAVPVVCAPLAQGAAAAEAGRGTCGVLAIPRSSAQRAEGIARTAVTTRGSNCLPASARRTSRLSSRERARR